MTTRHRKPARAFRRWGISLAVLGTAATAAIAGIATPAQAAGSFCDIAKATYLGPFSGDARPFLSYNEVVKLSIRKGSLTEDERREIESHVTHTYRFLTQIPWTRTLKHVPDIAYGHHEKLTGKGYPRSLKESEIALPTRMMTISDIYDALTASDRPYKRAVPKQKAYDILLDEAKRGELDPDLLRVFIEADVPGNAPQEP